VKQVANFPGYLMNENAEIFSVRRGGRLKKMCPHTNSQGYLGIGLRRDGKKHYRLVHRLLLETYVGDCPEGYQACHNDGNRLNNSLDNLRWDSIVNNHADKRKHGTMCKGTTHGKSKLTEDDVRSIRAKYAAGATQCELANEYKLVPSNISHIVNFITWKHV
jgi:hypothetical protein